MEKPNLYLVLLFSLISTTMLVATVIVPTENLGDYAKYSDIVGAFTFDYEEDRWEDGRIYTYLVFSRQEMWKGEVEQIEIRQMSYRTDTDAGFKFDVHIDLEPGRKYLLFLSQIRQHYFPGLCNYGIFDIYEHQEEKVLIPTRASINTQVMERSDGKKVERLKNYYYEELKQAVLDYLDGSSWPNKFSEVENIRLNDQHKAAPAGCLYLASAGGFIGMRWVNSNIDSYTDDDGDNDLPNVENCIDNALDAINNNYNVFLTSSGTTDYNPSCSGGSATDGYPSYANNNLSGTQTLLHIFNDPCGEIADLSGCTGTLAIGGAFYGGSNVFNGDTWYNAQHGYAIYNNGLGACKGCGDYEIVATHESTHALGMDHLSASSYPNNNMNPSCCNTINTKDIECMDYAYVASVPVELEFFSGVLQKSRVFLNWRSASELNCGRYIIEKSPDGRGDWKMIHEVGCHYLSNTPRDYEYVDEQLFSGDNYYRLIQEDTDGTKTYFDIVNVQYTPGGNWQLNYGNGKLQMMNVSEDLVGSNVSLYSIMGQQLFSGALVSGFNEWDIRQYSRSTSIVILHIESRQGVETHKLFIP